jgi:DNA-binding PadR family transcriptional regulator
MNLREVVLGLLLERPLHAYALKQVLAPRLPPAAQVNDGVLYPLLGELARQSLIKGTEEAGPGGRRRLVYRTTARGRQRFDRWLRSGADEGNEAAYDFFMGHPFLVKVQFFSHLNAVERRAKFGAERARIEAKIRLLEEVLHGMKTRRVDTFRVGLLELGIAQQKQTLNWLRGVAGRRRARAGRPSAA